MIAMVFLLLRRFLKQKGKCNEWEEMDKENEFLWAFVNYGFKPA